MHHSISVIGVITLEMDNSERPQFVRVVSGVPTRASHSTRVWSTPTGRLAPPQLEDIIAWIARNASDAIQLKFALSRSGQIQLLGLDSAE